MTLFFNRYSLRRGTNLTEWNVLKLKNFFDLLKRSICTYFNLIWSICLDWHLLRRFGLAIYFRIHLAWMTIDNPSAVSLDTLIDDAVDILDVS